MPEGITLGSRRKGFRDVPITSSKQEIDNELAANHKERISVGIPANFETGGKQEDQRRRTGDPKPR